MLQGQHYYKSREPTGDYKDYWKEAIDPDGKVRQRNSEQERQRYLGDIAEELTFLRSIQPGCILDIGCGLGWALSGISSIWKKHGTEISGRDVGRDVKLHGPNLEKLESGYFDVIFCHHVIEHIKLPLTAIKQMHRLLKKGGHLVIATPDFASPCAVRFGENYRLLHDKTHVSLFTNESMHRVLRDYGFTINRVAYPFPERYATAETMERWNDTSKVSPPWPGNWQTFFCRK